jgi:hypothetical protein
MWSWKRAEDRNVVKRVARAAYDHSRDHESFPLRARTDREEAQGRRWRACAARDHDAVRYYFQPLEFGLNRGAGGFFSAGSSEGSAAAAISFSSSSSFGRPAS